MKILINMFKKIKNTNDSKQALNVYTLIFSHIWERGLWAPKFCERSLDKQE